MGPLVLSHGLGAMIPRTHTRFDRRQAILSIAGVREPLFHVLAYRACRCGIGPLIMQRDPLTPRNRHRPAVGNLQPRENPEQGRFPRAVPSNDRQTIAGANPEGGAGKQRAGAKCLREPGNLHDL